MYREGQCRRCGKQVLGRRRSCRTCRQVHKTKRDLLRKFRLLHGLCPDCGKEPPEPGKNRCLACTCDNRISARVLTERKKARGICIRAGCRAKATSGRSMCLRCLRKNSATTRLYHVGPTHRLHWRCIRYGIPLTWKQVDAGLELVPVVAAAEGISPATQGDQVLSREVHEELGRFLETVGERDRLIFCRYYGLFGHKPASLADVGHPLGITRERVRQICSIVVGALVEWTKTSRVFLEFLGKSTVRRPRKGVRASEIELTRPRNPPKFTRKRLKGGKRGLSQPQDHQKTGDLARTGIPAGYSGSKMQSK